jgi:hypothetical protein
VKTSLILALIFQLLFIPLAQVQAQGLDEATRLRHFHSDLELKSRLLNTMVRTNERLNLTWDGLEARNLSPDQFERQWAESFETITKEYVETQLRIGGFDTRELGVVKMLFNQIRWNEMSKVYSATFRSMRNFARLHGTSLLAVLILTNLTQIVLVPFFTLIGQPLMALLVIKVPTTIPAVYLHHVISNASFERRMRQLFSSKEAYREYKKLDRRVLEVLHLTSKSDLVIPLPGDNEVIALKKTSMFKTLSQQFGFAEDHLNLSNVRSFMRKNGIHDAVLWGLHNDPNLSEKTKLIMMTYHLATNSEEQIMIKFRQRFSSSFSTLQSRPQGLAALERWTNQLLAARTPHDVDRLLQLLPREVAPQYLVAAWSEVILPEFAKGDQFTYGQIRQLSKRFHAFKIQMEVDPNEWNHPRLINELQSYFKSSLNSSHRGCYRSFQEVITTLSGRAF